MPTAVLPAMGKLREVRLAIQCPADEVRRPLKRDAPYAAAFRELWQGQLLLAALTRTDAHALTAFLETLDGQVNPFRVSLPTPELSRTGGYTASLASVPSLGADVLSLNLSPTSGGLKAGTLITVGNIDSGAFQLFEVLEDVGAGAPAAMRVAPRVRATFGIGAAVAVGSVNGKFTLADDALEATIMLSHGMVSLKVSEAL